MSGAEWDAIVVGKLIGLVKHESFLRRPVGPGFALVGDAGAVMDFVTGQGIADQEGWTDQRRRRCSR